MAASAGLAPLHLLELPFDGGAQAQFQRDRMQFVDDLAHVADATIQRGQRLRGAPVQQRLRGACAGVQHGDVQLERHQILRQVVAHAERQAAVLAFGRLLLQFGWTVHDVLILITISGDSNPNFIYLSCKNENTPTSGVMVALPCCF
jgi:hypothetical protein